MGEKDEEEDEDSGGSSGRILRRAFNIVWLFLRKSARVIVALGLALLSLVVVYVVYVLVSDPLDMAAAGPGAAAAAPAGIGSAAAPARQANLRAQSAAAAAVPPPTTSRRAAGGGTPNRTRAHLADPRAAPAPELRQADGGGVVPPVSRPDVEAEKVFLVMSAFRDGERCARTMGLALARAAYPDRIHFRVMQAIGRPSDVSCAAAFAGRELADFCAKRGDAARCKADVLDRVAVWTIPLEMGMGPAHQRGLLNEVRDHNDPGAFCVNTDSHMDFHERWDELMIKEWVGINNEFAVCTAYPMRMMKNQDKLFANSHVDLCGWFLEAGIPRGQGGDNLRSEPGQKPYLTMNWAAGFSFGRCHMDRNVPVDKHLKWIFTGEEVDRAVRLWTSGYDLYLPAWTYIYHDYDNAKQEFWSVKHDNSIPARSKDRLKAKLNITSPVSNYHRDLLRASRAAPSGEEPGFGLYGLGNQRTLEQYVEWARVDLGTPQWRNLLTSRGLTPVVNNKPHWFCQTLSRVPVRSSRDLRESVQQGGLPASDWRFKPRFDSSDPGALPVMALDEQSGL